MMVGAPYDTLWLPVQALLVMLGVSLGSLWASVLGSGKQRGQMD